MWILGWQHVAYYKQDRFHLKDVFVLLRKISRSGHLFEKNAQIWKFCAVKQRHPLRLRLTKINLFDFIVIICCSCLFLLYEAFWDLFLVHDQIIFGWFCFCCVFQRFARKKNKKKQRKYVLHFAWIVRNQEHAEVIFTFIWSIRSVKWNFPLRKKSKSLCLPWLKFFLQN